MFFTDVKTIEELKAEYKRLAKLHHPDKGGDVSTMQAVNKEYEVAFERVRLMEGVSQSDIDDEIELERIFMEKVQAIAHLQGITIELVGRWLWVTGHTYPVRDIIKAAGFFWARKKRAWYWHAPQDNSRNRKELSLEEIRERHGSTVVKPNVVPSLTS